MKVRHYPGRATAIGPSTMEFQYEANWQEVTEKWALQDREKRAAQTVKDISRIGVKLPGLTGRVHLENKESLEEKDSKKSQQDPLLNKQPNPVNTSIKSPVEKQFSNLSDRNVLPINGFQLKRSSSDIKTSSNKPYSELEQRYQIITTKDVGSIPENLIDLVRKQTEVTNKQEVETVANGNTKDKSNSFKQTKQAVATNKEEERGRHHDEQESVQAEVPHPGTSHARTIHRSLNNRDLHEDSTTAVKNDPVPENVVQPPKPLPRTDIGRAKPLHQRNPNDVITPPPPKMKPVNSSVKFRNEPPTIIPKRMDAFLDDGIPPSPYDYLEYPIELDDVPKPKETLELQPIPPSLKPVRVQPREDEIVSSWAARKRREMQQEKQRRKALISNHHPYEDIDSWHIEEDDSLYNGNITKKGKGSLSDESSSNVSRQKSNSSDLLRDSFRIGPKERTSSLDSGNYEHSKTSPIAKFSDYNSDSLETDFRLHRDRTSPVDSVIEPDSLNPIESQESEFVIPRPKLIVPVHTYGIRKRRTGNMLHSSRRGSDAETILSGHSASDKKHHTSCPGKAFNSHVSHKT